MRTSALLLIALLLTATPALARHCHNWNPGWANYGANYGAPYGNYYPAQYRPRQGFLNYLVNGNPQGYSYFNQNAYYPGAGHWNNGLHRGWYHQHHHHWN